MQIKISRYLRSLMVNNPIASTADPEACLSSISNTYQPGLVVPSAIMSAARAVWPAPFIAYPSIVTDTYSTGVCIIRSDNLRSTGTDRIVPFGVKTASLAVGFGGTTATGADFTNALISNIDPSNPAQTLGDMSSTNLLRYRMGFLRVAALNSGVGYPFAQLVATSDGSLVSNIATDVRGFANGFGYVQLHTADLSRVKGYASIDSLEASAYKTVPTSAGQMNAIAAFGNVNLEGAATMSFLANVPDDFVQNAADPYSDAYIMIPMVVADILSVTPTSSDPTFLPSRMPAGSLTSGDPCFAMLVVPMAAVIASASATVEAFTDNTTVGAVKCAMDNTGTASAEVGLVGLGRVSLSDQLDSDLLALKPATPVANYS